MGAKRRTTKEGDGPRRVEVRAEGGRRAEVARQRGQLGEEEWAYTEDKKDQ